MSAAEFDQHADDYEGLLDHSLLGEEASYFYEHKVRYLERIVGAGFAGKILDFGCGIGRLSEGLGARFPGATLHGYDPSLRSLERVPAPLREAGTFTSDLEALGRDYDLITLVNVLHHVPVPERPALVAGLAGRLAPGGRLVVIEHNPLNPATRLVVSRCAFDEDAVLLGRREVQGLLRGAGLRRERADYVLFFPQPLARLARAERFLGWLPLGAQFAAVFRR